MTSVIKMWHGGKFEEYGPVTIQTSRTGKTENGPGVYTTNNIYTGGEYAKGGKKLYYMELKSDLVLLEDSKILYEDAIKFVLDSRGMRKKKEIIEDIKRNMERANFVENGKPLINATVLLNLMTNYDVCKGEHGPNLANFYKNYGIDASLISTSNRDEGWLLIFNTDIILNKRSFSQKEIKEYQFSSFEEPSIQLSRAKFQAKSESLSESIFIKDLPLELKAQFKDKHQETLLGGKVSEMLNFEKVPVKIIDLETIKSDKILDVYNSEARTFVDQMVKNNDLIKGIVSEGKLILGQEEMSFLLKRGIKEMVVIDASNFIKPELTGYITDVSFTEQHKRKTKNKNVL